MPQMINDMSEIQNFRDADGSEVTAADPPRIDNAASQVLTLTCALAQVSQTGFQSASSVTFESRVTFERAKICRFREFLNWQSQIREPRHQWQCGLPPIRCFGLLDEWRTMSKPQRCSQGHAAAEAPRCRGEDLTYDGSQTVANSSRTAAAKLSSCGKLQTSRGKAGGKLGLEAALELHVTSPKNQVFTDHVFLGHDDYNILIYSIFSEFGGFTSTLVATKDRLSTRRSYTSRRLGCQHFDRGRSLWALQPP